MQLFLLTIGAIWLIGSALLWRRGSDWTLDSLMAGLLFLGTLGFFWRVVRGEVYQPADGGDLVSFLYPTYRFAASQLSQWSLPLWNPHLYGGAPFISDIQAGFLYPPNLLLFFFNPNFDYRWMQFLVQGHLYWAGLGLYVLLRTLPWGPDGQPVTRLAALFGGLAFQFSDPFLTHLGNLNLIAVLSWLPWVLAAYHRSLDRRSMGWAAVAGLLFAISTYAGHAQSSFYIALALGLYTVGWTVRRVQLRLMLDDLRWTIVHLALALLVAFLLTAPILLPALELSAYTARQELTYMESAAFSLAPPQAIGLITPGFFGRGPALYWSLWDRVETPYAGVATLLLAIAALFLFRHGADRRRIWIWVGMGGAGFLIALGIYTPVHGWLTGILPIFDQFRAPARALILWTLGITVLAGVGMDKMQRSQIESWPLPSITAFFGFLRWGALILLGLFTPLLYLSLLLTQSDPTAFLRASVATIAVALAGGFWLATWLLLAGRRAGRLSPSVMAVGLTVLLYLDLTATGAYTDISEKDPTQGFQHPEIVAFLRNDPELGRLDARTGIDQLWQPDLAALAGLQDVWGIVNPLVLRSWSESLEATGGRDTDRYHLLNVKYVVALDTTPLPANFELALDAPGELALFRNRDVWPRVWVGDETVLESDSVSLAQRREDPTQITHYGANQLTIQVQASAPGYLVLSEAWYPGWRATVNGEAQAVRQVFGALRAVEIPAGASTVKMHFAPRSWRLGLGLFGLGTMILLGLWGWTRSRGSVR